MTDPLIKLIEATTGLLEAVNIQKAELESAVYEAKKQANRAEVYADMAKKEAELMKNKK